MMAAQGGVKDGEGGTGLQVSALRQRRQGSRSRISNFFQTIKPFRAIPRRSRLIRLETRHKEAEAIAPA